MHAAPLLLGLLLVVTGCQTPAPARIFSVAELGPILLQPSEAPDGTNFITEASGPVTVEEAAQGHAELSARWEELGFEGGEVVLFSSTAEPPSAEFALIGNSGLIFESPDAASEALEAHRTIGVPNLT